MGIFWTCFKHIVHVNSALTQTDLTSLDDTTKAPNQRTYYNKLSCWFANLKQFQDNGLFFHDLKF